MTIRPIPAILAAAALLSAPMAAQAVGPATSGSYLNDAGGGDPSAMLLDLFGLFGLIVAAGSLVALGGGEETPTSP